MDTLPHSFRDRALCELALTHSSAGQATDYERLEFLGDAECITQLQKLALTGMSQVFEEDSPQLEIGLDLIARQKVLEGLWLDQTNLSNETLIKVLDRLISGDSRGTLKDLGLCNAVKISDRRAGERVIDLINCAPRLRRVDIRRTGSHEPHLYRLRIEVEEQDPLREEEESTTGR